MYGGYENLEYGYVHEGLSMLLGAPCKRIEIKGDVEIIWEQLVSAFSDNYIMGATTHCSQLVNKDSVVPFTFLREQ